MSFTGDLKKLPLGDVFQNIHQNEMSGALAITEDRGEWLVAFEGGFVTGCASPASADAALGDELVRRRVVDADTVARASGRFFKRKGTLRKALKKKRILESGEFDGLARTILLERVYDCFLLEEGTFEFREEYDTARFDDDERSATLKIAPTEILMEAMRRIDEWKRIRRSIPSFREVYVAAREPVTEGDDADDAIRSEMLSLTAAGTLDLATVLARVPASRFGALEAVHELIQQGAMRIATAPEYLELGRAAEEQDDMATAAALYARGLVYERGNAELNARRISILEHLGKKQEAASELKLYAGTLLEHGDSSKASDAYARAARLSPTDPLPLERLLELERKTTDLESARRAAEKLVTLYLQLGLGEQAKSVYPSLLQEHPRDRWLRERLAETYAKLHEGPAAAQIFKELAQEEIAKGDAHDAAAFLRRALEAAPDDAKAKALLDDLESGEYQARKKRRRRYAILATVSTLLTVVGFWGVYEAEAISHVHTATLGGIDRLDHGPEGILEALVAHQDARDTYRYSLVANQRADALGERLAELYARAALRSGEPRLWPASPDEPLEDAAVLERLRAILGADDAPGPEGLLADAEAALAADERGTANTLLGRLDEQLRNLRLVIVRAGPNARAMAGVLRAERRLRALLPRFHLARARAQLTLPAARAVLDAHADQLRSGSEPATPVGGNESTDDAVDDGADDAGTDDGSEG